MKKIFFYFGFCIFFFFLISNVSAYDINNESLKAKELLDLAKLDIQAMIEKGISINRINETYDEALQLYEAQKTFDILGGKARYNQVIDLAEEVLLIKKQAFLANDELEVFKETFLEASKDTNFSEMEDEYNQILLSFKEERFEDTMELIERGYERLSEIQASQTALKLFYATTSGTIKNFFKNTWKKILLGFSIILFFIFVFWNSLIKLKRRIRLNNLIIQKNAIKNLLKKIQKDYFEKKQMSESEYSIKIQKYNELIRDIDRQIMILREEIFISKNKEEKKKSSKILKKKNSKSKIKKK